MFLPFLAFSVSAAFRLLAAAEGTTARKISNKFGFRSLNSPFRRHFVSLISHIARYAPFSTHKSTSERSSKIITT